MKTFSQFIAEAKFEKHMSPDEKEDIRNQRAFGSTSLKNRATGMRRTFHAAERGIKKEIPTGNEKSEISSKYDTTRAELRREIRRLKGLKSGRDFSKRVKQKLEADRYIKQQNSEFAAKNAQNKIVRTFREFIEISERYYKPDEKLPSGKTPVQKAEQKNRNRARTIASQPPKNQERWVTQYDRTQTKVKHGADNPQLNTKISHKDKDHIKIDSDEDGMYLHHKPSGVNFTVTKSDESPWDDVRTVSWGHDKNKMRMNPKERVKLGMAAKQVWNQHVSHRLPKGSVVHNSPSSSLDNSGRQKPINRRSEIYKRAGFGPLDSEGDQFASVGREPSSRQKAKGKKSRLKPLNPRRTKVDVEWGKDRDNDYDYDYDED